MFAGVDDHVLLFEAAPRPPITRGKERDGTGHIDKGNRKRDDAGSIWHTTLARFGHGVSPAPPPRADIVVGVMI